MKGPIGLDTNALLNFRLKREPGFKQVFDLLASCAQGKVHLYLPLPTILETEWVLRSVYKQPREEIYQFLDELFQIENVLFDNKPEIQLALNLYRTSKTVSFTDSVIVILVHNKKYTFLTFDQNLKKIYQSLV